jgi:nicotinamidase-related amidase
LPRPLPVDLIEPDHTALVTQECQRGVLGVHSSIPALAEEARREAIPNIARLVEAAHRAGIQVIHCTMNGRPDRRGANHNAPLFRMGRPERDGSAPAVPASDFGQLLPEFELLDADMVLPRVHGLGPMGGTELDHVLRNLGVTTIVGVGVSANVAMPNFVMDAVNAGYEFVLPRDAIAGIPREYAEAVIRNTLSLLTTLTTTDDLVAAWS